VCLSGRSARLTVPSYLGIHPRCSGGDPNSALGHQTSSLMEQLNNPGEAPARSGVEQEEKKNTRKRQGRTGRVTRRNNRSDREGQQKKQDQQGVAGSSESNRERQRAAGRDTEKRKKVVGMKRVAEIEREAEQEKEAEREREAERGKNEERKERGRKGL
jgi:hypothetical protein